MFSIETPDKKNTEDDSIVFIIFHQDDIFIKFKLVNPEIKMLEGSNVLKVCGDELDNCLTIKVAGRALKIVAELGYGVITQTLVLHDPQKARASLRACIEKIENISMGCDVQ